MEGKAIRQLRHPTRLAGWLRRYYMDNREFLAGQVVTIYEDPITETTPEGTAVLVSLIERSVTGAAERWWVQFLDDDFHNQVERTIKVKGGK